MVSALGALLTVALAACGDSGSVVATDPSTGWKTIEYQGVRVDVPKGWHHADMDGCEIRVERWTPADLSPCSPDGGVFFYRSATFDPADGPGIRHDDAADDAPAWDGYVYAGDFAVYVADDDRALVGHVLDSVHALGE